MSPPSKPPPKRRVLISRATKERLRNALLTGTAGGYLGSMILPGGKSGMKGARIGASVGALIGATNRGKRSTTADGVATGGDWKFQATPKVQGRRVMKRRVPATADPERPDLKRLASRPAKHFSAYVEDMTFGQLPDDVQKDVLRFVDAKAKTPVVHYGMTVQELIAKADPANLEAARKAVKGGKDKEALRRSVLLKTKRGSKYLLLMNDRIVDGHHFLAKAEHAGVTSSLNVLDLTPARLSLVKFAAASKPEGKPKPSAHDRLQVAKDVGTLGLIGGAGVGGAKVYRRVKRTVDDLEPAARRLFVRGHRSMRRMDKLAKGWQQAAAKTADTLDVVRDAVAPVAKVNRGIGGAGKAVGKTVGKLVKGVGSIFFSDGSAPPKRDGLAKARDAALLAGGLATAGAGGTAIVRGKRLAQSAKVMAGQAARMAENIRHSTRISADVGRAYGAATEPLRRPKRMMVKVRQAWREGMRQGMSKPAPLWARAAARVSKAIGYQDTRPETRFMLAPLMGSLAGAYAGSKMRAPAYRALLKRIPGQPLSKGAKRMARVGAIAVEQGMPALGGAAGGLLIGKKKKLDEAQMAARNRHGLVAFGGADQQADLRTGTFIDPLDSFIGRKRGYAKAAVKDYNRLRRWVDDVQSGRRSGSATAIARAQSAMRSIEASPATASHGQVIKSVMRKADTAQRWGGRGMSLAKDAVAHVKGDAREKDAWGRAKKREWEKPWFQRRRNQLLAATAIYGGALLMKKNPGVRQAYDKAKATVQRQVNKQAQNFFPQQPAQAAPAVNPTQIIQAGKAGRPTGRKIARTTKLSSRVPTLFFNDAWDAGWDLRDARGRSARVFAPGSRPRERREKKWHEKLHNERLLWSGGILASGLAGAMAGRKLAMPLKRTRKAATRVTRPKAGPPPASKPRSNVIVLPRPGQQVA